MTTSTIYPLRPQHLEILKLGLAGAKVDPLADAEQFFGLLAEEGGERAKSKTRSEEGLFRSQQHNTPDS